MIEILWHRRETRRSTKKTNLKLNPGSLRLLDSGTSWALNQWQVFLQFTEVRFGILIHCVIANAQEPSKTCHWPGLQNHLQQVVGQHRFPCLTLAL